MLPLRRLTDPEAACTVRRMIEQQGAAVILGAGPAGLAAAVELARAGRRVVVIERGRSVGGLARTEVYKGFRFDIGGHRFYTKSDEIQRFWREALGGDFLLRPRLSRIYYRGRFFRYPLRAWDTLTGLGPLEAARALTSYLRRWAMPLPPEDTFERWVVNRFGERLYETFFKSYTEKVWGVPCSELRAEWAAQRLKDLSLGAVLVRAMGLNGNGARSMIEEFHYPRLGPGMLWEAVQALAEKAGARFRLGAEVTGIERDGGRVRAVVIRDASGLERIEASAVISSIPLRPFVSMLDAPAPDDVRRAASGLRHRDYLTVCLILRRRELFPDNWIYVHDPRVRVARIQNFKNWSPDMVPDADKTSLGLEFFCREGDSTWSLRDAELVELATRELAEIGLARREDVEDGCVFRVSHAYPIYDASYRAELECVKAFLAGLDNCQTIGRNGLHRYNNQDHAALSGLLAARNLLQGQRRYDVWSIGSDADYFEEDAAAPATASRRGPAFPASVTPAEAGTLAD
jgi:protoporphyrinogen oxidase